VFRPIAAAICIATACFAQAPEFEVATVKSSPPPEKSGMFVGARGGPGTDDLGRFTCTSCSLMMLLTMAYNVQRFQVKGPATLESERFEVAAKVPEGVTRERLREMIQSLLADRFKLKLHHESKVMTSYRLVVGRGGPKLTESKTEAAPAAEASLPPQASGPPQRDTGGYPIIPHGRGSMIAIIPGRARIQAERETMPQLAAKLSNFLGQPVNDATGLKGKYDFVLSWSPEEGRSMMAGAPPPPPGLVPDGPMPSAPQEMGPTLFAALREQLGLRLDQKKGWVDLLVIDHIETTPVKN
jgi:uncharacterized protein (TIGR03435 family)